MDDEAIIELYLKRIERAIEETSIKYGLFLKTIALNIVGSSEDTEECVNDTYYRTWHAIPPQKPTYFKSFLAKITRNIALDCYRKKTALKRKDCTVHPILEELEMCIPSTPCLEQEIEIKELATLINQFLEKQTQDNRVIFMRRYWYNDSMAQIAARFEISESKVKSSLFRTRNALRIFLEKEGVWL